MKSLALLLLTLPTAILLQIFNLFYGIGDIYVFYIPLYFIAALWAACGVDWLIRAASGKRTTDRRQQIADDERTTHHVLRITFHCVHHSPVRGDQLHLHVEILRQMRGIWKYKAEARVDGEIVAEAELMCAKRDVA